MMWETPKGSRYIKEESNNIFKEVFTKMKTKRKALLLSLCAVLLVVASVMGTMAYLTSRDTVTNTFTIGNVQITLDETKVNLDGTVVTGDEAGVTKANKYLLMPGHQYTKDPTVHVDPVSEDSYIFVKVENGISKYEGTPTIASQITSAPYSWTALTGVDGVYYKEYTKSNDGANLKVFGGFTIADNANGADGWANINEQTTKIIVTAYAIQKDGTGTPDDAWAKVSAQYQNP